MDYQAPAAQLTGGRPPTSQQLKPGQRVRLLRSTRKVEAILGEVPLFVEASKRESALPAVLALPLVPPRKSSLMVYIPQNLSPGLAADSSPAAHPRPVLAVRIPKRNRDSVDSLALRLSVIDPALPSASSASTSFSVNEKDEERRRRQRAKKMAKISRTLGERVPPELLFRASASERALRKRSSRESLRVGRKTSYASLRTSFVDLVEDDDEEAEWEEVVEDPEAAQRHSERLPAASGSRSERAQPQMPRRGSHKRTGHHIAPAPLPLHPAPAPAFQPALQSATPQRFSSRPFANASADAYLQIPVGYDRGTHRTEKGWSGEWTGEGARMENMDEVAQKLRGLKMK